MRLENAIVWRFTNVQGYFTLFNRDLRPRNVTFCPKTGFSFFSIENHLMVKILLVNK